MVGDKRFEFCLNPIISMGYVTLCNRVTVLKMDRMTLRNHITGRANPGSAATYGNSNVMLPALALQMERIERIL